MPSARHDDLCRTVCTVIRSDLVYLEYCRRFPVKKKKTWFIYLFLMTFCDYNNPHSSLHPSALRLHIYLVRSYSHRVRGVQSPPGQSGDGIPGLLHPGPAGSGAGALPGWVPVGQDADDHRADAGCADPRGRWVSAVYTWKFKVSPFASWLFSVCVFTSLSSAH